MRKRVMVAIGCLVASALGGGCGGGQNKPADEPSAVSGEAGESDDGSSSAAPAGASERDAPEISRSVGEEGGVVVFWTRVIPSSDDESIQGLASTLQSRMAAIASKGAPGRAQDVRPEPERVCPRDGCAGATAGALLIHLKGGCVALGLVAEPGKSETQIVPWAGDVKLAKKRVAFRDPPESEVTVVDAVPCGELEAALDAREADLVEAVRKVADGG